MSAGGAKGPCPTCGVDPDVHETPAVQLRWRELEEALAPATVVSDGELSRLLSDGAWSLPMLYELKDRGLCDSLTPEELESAFVGETISMDGVGAEWARTWRWRGEFLR